MDSPALKDVTVAAPDADHEQSEWTRLRSRLIRDFSNYLLSKIIPGLAGLISVLVFVRVAGYEQYGRYSVVYALCMSIGAGLSGWIVQGMLRFRSAHAESALGFDRSIAAATLISICLAGAVAAVVTRAADYGRYGMFAGAIVLACGFLGYSVLLGRLQTSLRSGLVVRTEAVRAILSLICPVVLAHIFPTYSASMLVLGMGLGYVIPVILSLRRSRWEHAFDLARHPLKTAEERKTLRQVFAFGWPLALWFFCVQVLALSDRYFLQRHSLQQTGIYASLFDTVVRSLSLLFAPVVLAVHPVIMRRWNAGRRTEAFRVLRTAVLFEILTFVPIVAGFWISASYVSRIVLGQKHPGADNLIVPLLIGGFLWQLALLAHKPLEILCLTPRMLAGMFCALVVDVTGNILFVSRYGYLASAYITIAAALAYITAVLCLTPGVKSMVFASEGEVDPE